MPEVASRQVEPAPSPRLVRSTLGKSGQRRKIWIDLDNSPHVPFFAPIIEELENSGHSILITARDCFQVFELADMMHLSYQRVGRHYGKHIIWKLSGLCLRALQLMPNVWSDRPDLALSHGSRSQLIVANLLHIPSVTIADYEFTKIWMLIRPTWVITPEIVPNASIHCSKERLLKYPGIKEDVYVPRFKPDPSILASLGLDGTTDLVVLIRPPATEAHYHRPESDALFAAVLDFLEPRSQVKMILLPRNAHQTADIRLRWPHLFATGRLRIPDHVADGLNLIWHSDLVISGGGTMNREAAALGVPVYSIFCGQIGAVDRYLASVRRLTLIERPEDVAHNLILTKRAHVAFTERRQRDTLNIIVGHVERILQQSH